MDLGISLTILFAIVVLGWEIVRDSEYRRYTERQKEREAILLLMKEVKGMSANPDVNDYYRKLEAKIVDRFRSQK